MKKVLIPKDEAQLKEWVSLLDRGAGVPFRYVAVGNQVAIEVDAKDAEQILGITGDTTATPAPAPQTKKKRLPRWARIALWVLGVWTLLAIILPKGSDEPEVSTAPPMATPIDSATQRRELIERQFSVWDGSHPGVTRAIKASMNDPKSYDHVETVFWDRGDYLLIRTRFRGKNAFGGVILNTVNAKVDFSGNVLDIALQEE